MKSKELIYLASTAILLAATANVVQAEENTPTTTDPEVAKAELQVKNDHQPQQGALAKVASTDQQVKQETSVVRHQKIWHLLLVWSRRMYQKIKQVNKQNQLLLLKRFRIQ